MQTFSSWSQIGLSNKCQIIAGDHNGFKGMIIYPYYYFVLFYLPIIQF